MHRKKTRVYVIEPDEDVRAVICDVLEDAGWEPVRFASALPALEAARVHPPDIVVTELSMSKMSGRDFVQRLREIGLREVEVIAMTTGDVESAIDVAFHHVLHKPFGVAELVAAVRSACAGRRARR